MASFLYFIKNEEDEYRKEIYNNEKGLKNKNKKILKFKKIKPVKKSVDVNINDKENLINLNNDINMNKIWFKWKINSCRYDSFSLIYSLVIYPKLCESIETPENHILQYLNNLFYKCIDLNNKEYEKGFWVYLKKNRDKNVDLTTDLMCFERKGSLYQILDLFRYDKNFCFEYKLEEGCTNINCMNRLITMNYLNPYIIFREEDIKNNSNIIKKINSLLANDLTTCNRCGYDKEGNILNIDNPTFYRLINCKKFPKVLFVLFDLLNYNDTGNRNELEKIEFNKRKFYKDKLSEILCNSFNVENHIYELKALILTPQYDHFTSIILDYQNDLINFKKGNNYYYDGMTINHFLEEIKNLKDILNTNIIYLGAYLEKNKV